MEFNRVEYKRALTDGLKQESVMQVESGLESRLGSGLESKTAKNVLRVLAKQPLQRDEIADALGYNQVLDAINRSVKELSRQVILTVRSQPFALTPNPASHGLHPTPKTGRGELILVFQLFKLFLRKSLAPFSQIWEKGVWGMRAVQIVQVKAQVGAQVEAQVDLNILQACFLRPLSSAEIAAALGHQQLSGNLRKALPRLRKAGFLEYTIPEKPNSRLQKYRLTALGQSLLATKGNRHE